MAHLWKKVKSEVSRIGKVLREHDDLVEDTVSPRSIKNKVEKLSLGNETTTEACDSKTTEDALHSVDSWGKSPWGTSTRDWDESFLESDKPPRSIISLRLSKSTMSLARRRVQTKQDSPEEGLPNIRERQAESDTVRYAARYRSSDRTKQESESITESRDEQVVMARDSYVDYGLHSQSARVPSLRKPKRLRTFVSKRYKKSSI